MPSSLRHIFIQALTRFFQSKYISHRSGLLGRLVMCLNRILFILINKAAEHNSDFYHVRSVFLGTM